MVFLVPWLCPEAWYTNLCVKLQDRDKKGVSGDRFCVSEEQNYFYLNVSWSVKYLHGRTGIWWFKDAYQKERYLLAVWEREFLIPCSLLPSLGTFHTNTVRSCNFLASQYPEYRSWIISPLAWASSVSPQLSCPQILLFHTKPTGQEEARFYLWNILFMYLKLPPVFGA